MTHKFEIEQDTFNRMYYLYDETQRPFLSAIYHKGNQVVWFKTLKRAKKAQERLNK